MTQCDHPKVIGELEGETACAKCGEVFAPAVCAPDCICWEQEDP